MVNLASVSEVQTKTVELATNLGAGSAVRSTVLSWASDNDDKNLYLAFQWSDPTRNNAFDLTGPLDSDGLLVFFDDDGDGVQEANEDGKAILAAFDGTQYVDQHNTVGDQTDEVGNGFGRISYDAALQRYSVEFLIPVDDDTDGTDGVKSAATRFNAVILDGAKLSAGQGDGGLAYGPVGIGALTGDWPKLLWSEAPGAGHKEIPSDLSGLNRLCGKTWHRLRDLHAGSCDRDYTAGHELSGPLQRGCLHVSRSDANRFPWIPVPDRCRRI